MKKKAQNEIIGRRVMVHPHLTTDPIQRLGETGKVMEVSAMNNEVLIVHFNDGKKGAYFSDGLLTLYPKEVILQGLQSNTMKPESSKLILSVLKLAGEKRHEEALKLAMTNGTTKFFCTTTTADWLDMKKEQRKNLNKSRGSNTL